MTDLTIHDITFYEGELTAVLTGDGRVFVSPAQMGNALGIDPGYNSAQANRGGHDDPRETRQVETRRVETRRV